jgi:hypothetical protein
MSSSVPDLRPFGCSPRGGRPARSILDGYRHPPSQLVHVRVEYRWTRAIVYELAIPPGFDETGAGQLFQVMRNGRLSDGETPAKRSATHLRLLRDMLQNLEPSRIRQRLRDPLKLL